MNHKDYFIYIRDRMIEELKFAQCEELDYICDMIHELHRSRNVKILREVPKYVRFEMHRLFKFKKNHLIYIVEEPEMFF